uniref:Major facilitator superfamily (MFS) profile domain-containing protein n=1 Tax=Fusarium oxysporum (strain Fo5176) TaxID=660025 RepID=A0A0D2Y4B9_FUSOF
MASAEMKDTASPYKVEASNQTLSSPPSVNSSDQTKTAQEDEEAQTTVTRKTKPAFNRDYRFWMIMVTLVLATLLASLEATVVITSLPTIVESLNLGSSYIWVTNVFFLTTGIAGGANGGAMLIAGRAIQGIGSGGVTMANDVIISDLVPLRYRGNYIAILLLVATIGFAVGPFLGGVIVENTTWRWSTMDKLRRIDYIGNAILIASSVSILIALTWAGPVYPWSDARILAPLIIGLVGLVGFVLYEASGIPSEPVMPIRLFPGRTSYIVYINTFLNMLLIQWCYFFLPLYFQAVKLSTPSRSGVQMLPVALIAIPGAALSAVVLSKWGKYKMLHVSGFFLMTLGVGLLGLLQEDSPPAAWILLQFIPAIGSGFLLNTLLPAFQAATEEEDQAAATGNWTFMRSFGSVWGVAIAGSIFNTYTKRYSHMIDNELAREMLGSGDSYQTFGGLAWVLSLFEKDVPLRKELDTQYGLDEKAPVEQKKEEAL